MKPTPHRHLNMLPLATLLVALSGAAAAQDAAGQHTTQIQADTGPVTVVWGQPSTLPNASDYAVRIADLDRNGDGRLSRREVPAGHALNSEFKLVDRNHDGYITEAELAAWH